MVKTVHYPEFSEFGFGYTVTNGLTHFRSGSLSPWPMLGATARWRHHPHFWDEHHTRWILENEFNLTPRQAQALTDAYGAPFIPTQNLEKKFPVDVALTSSGIFYFLQFKRSSCVSAKRANLIEVKSNKFNKFKLPFYRVGFSGDGDREQRKNLKRLEISLAFINSALVRYTVPAFHTLAELSEVHQNGLGAQINGHSSVMCFRASDFNLPGTGNHHISYDASGTGWRFSNDPSEGPKVQPLISEINKIAPSTEPLGKAMRVLCETLDKLAAEMKIPERPKELDDQALIRMFNLKVRRPKQEAPDIAFFQTPVSDQEVTKELADGIRKMMKYPIDDGLSHQDGVPSKMEFLRHFFGADYRCQQIIGQPLLVGIQL